MREHFVVPSIRGRKVAPAERSRVRRCEDALNALDFGNSPLGVHSVSISDMRVAIVKRNRTRCSCLLPAIGELRKRLHSKRLYYKALRQIGLNASTVRSWFRRSHCADDLIDMLDPKPARSSPKPEPRKRLEDGDSDTTEHFLHQADKMAAAILRGKYEWAARLAREDNAYVYLAATRLSLYRSVADWAMVIGVFGFSPPAGLPDTSIHTFASRLHNRDAPEPYSAAGYDPDCAARRLASSERRR